MAILWIMTRNNTNPDSTKDQRACYKRGDILRILPDTAIDVFSIVANPIQAPFLAVKVTDRDETFLQQFLIRDTRFDATTARGTNPAKARLYRVLVDDAPAIAAKIGTDRYIEVTWAQLRTFVQNKVTLVTQ